jgi:hypothetical protein
MAIRSLGLSALGIFFLLVGQLAQAQEQSDTAADFPVKRVVLFSSGV